jgi:hypothetical protein
MRPFSAHVPYVAHEVCVGLPDSGPETVCATWPGCPDEGTMTLQVQAAWGDVLGPPTGEMTCQFTKRAPCECLPVTVRSPPGPFPAPPPPTTDLTHPGDVLSTASPVAPTGRAPVSTPPWTMPTQPAAT